MKIKLRQLKEGLKCLLCFTDSSPAKFSASEFRRQPALSDNTVYWSWKNFHLKQVYIKKVVTFMIFFPLPVGSMRKEKC